MSEQSKPKPVVLPEVIKACYDILRLDLAAVDGPYNVEVREDSEKSGKFIIHAPEPWRRRPNRFTKDGNWQEMTDVAQISGGLSNEARAIANFFARVREAAPLAAAALLQQLGYPEEPADGSGNVLDGIASAEPESEPDPDAEQMAVRNVRTSIAYSRLLEDIADALDRFLDSDQGHWNIIGEAVTNRNAPADQRLVSGGSDARAWRAALLRAFADVIDPTHDKKRLAALPASSRIAANARPSGSDFYTALRHCGVHDHRTQTEVDAEVKDMERRFKELRQRQRELDPIKVRAEHRTAAVSQPAS